MSWSSKLSKNCLLLSEKVDKYRDLNLPKSKIPASFYKTKEAAEALVGSKSKGTWGSWEGLKD
jgi:hypothetical protein